MYRVCAWSILNAITIAKAIMLFLEGINFEYFRCKEGFLQTNPFPVHASGHPIPSNRQHYYYHYHHYYLLKLCWIRQYLQQWYPYFWCIFRGWLPPRKHRYNIGRYIGQYIQYWTITKWTNGQNLGLYITKIGNIEDLRGHNVNVEHNNDIYGNITLSIIVGQ